MTPSSAADLRDQVLRVLYQEGTATKELIAVLVGASPEDVSVAIASLMANGLVRVSQRVGVGTGSDTMLELAVR